MKITYNNCQTRHWQTAKIHQTNNLSGNAGADSTATVTTIAPHKLLNVIN